MASSQEDKEYKNMRRVIKHLEEVDDLVIEAAQDALWYQEKHGDEIKISIGKADLKIFQESRAAYQNNYQMEDMLRHLADTRSNQRVFDTAIASIIKVMDKTVQRERGKWFDWYDRMQKAGDVAWKDLVPATKSIGVADVINALMDKFASLDRILEVLKVYLKIVSQRAKFSDELRDTLFALVAVIKTGGPYAPIDMNEVNVLKTEIRRRREAEEAQLVLPTTHASNVLVPTTGYVEETETPPQPQATPNEPVAVLLHKWSSTVTATVMILFAVILAAIPGYKAWQYSPRKPGTIQDADFWFVVQGSMMQLVGLLTIILPLTLSGRLLIQRWFWTWLLVGVSFSCSVAPIPVYLYFPTEWSATVAFLGSAAQAFVTLQALFIVNKEKTL
ncbi:uncharacterized protein K441DRAFT_640740 [Cenococcum geophilum 1.58]|uniref:uncharacterized protein n=1 Tax=Cenococcum geophilum 1.58 TaxID=794803 RepID=UPI00358E263F|nr:hypothetical protein K441DRAFT_640740 [Cenococcum geophilum 1.58]